jgi:hypothetical protein
LPQPLPNLLQHVPTRRPLSPLAWLAIALCGALGLFWFHRVDFTSHFSLVSGDSGDTRLIAFLLEHQWQAFLGHATWTSPPMFFPIAGTLGYADAFVLQGLLYWPLRALGCDLFTALQFSTVLWNALNYAAMAWLLHRVLRLGALPTIAGSLLFAFNSAKFNQFVHLQLQPLVLLPLMFGLCVDLARRSDALAQRAVFLRLAALALLLDLQLLSGVYVAWFLGFFALLYLALLLLLAPTRAWLLALVRAWIRPLFGALAVFCVGLIPFLVLYVPVLRQAGWRSYGDAFGMIPRWFSLLAMGEGNWLWAWLEPHIPHFYDQPFFWEHRIGLGLVVTLAWLLLAGLALRQLLQLRRAPLNTSHFLVILILAVSVFYALGMTYFGHSPWWFAFHTVPGIKSIRAVSRYVIVLALPMGVAFAWVLDALMPRLRLPAQLAMGLLVAFAALEQVGTRYGYDKAAETQRLETLAAQLPKDCRAFYLTSPTTSRASMVSLQIDAMFVAQLTGVPTLNGYSGQEPKGWAGLYYLHAPGYREFAYAWALTHAVRGRLCELNDPQ